MYIRRKINIKYLTLETIFVSEIYLVEQQQFFHGTPKYQQVPLEVTTAVRYVHFVTFPNA